MIGLLPVCFVIDPWVCFFFAKCFYILWMLVIFSYNIFFNKSNTFFSGNSEQYKFYESQNNSPHCGKQSNAGKMYESYVYHFTSYAISNFITWKYICPKSKVLKVIYSVVMSRSNLSLKMFCYKHICTCT